MGLLSKIFGIDKGIDITAKNCIEHMIEVQKYVNDREKLIKYLSSNNINYIINKSLSNETTLHLNWAINIGKIQRLELTHTDNYIYADFNEILNNPLTPISFSISDNGISYNIDVIYTIQNIPLPSMCQTFIKSLETRNIHKQF